MTICRVTKAGFAATLLLVTSVDHVRADDPDWAARFRTEAPAAWEAAQERQRHVQGRFRSVIRGNIPGAENDENEVEVKSNAEAACVVTRKLKTGSAEVFAYNPHYTFRLKSHGDQGWALVSIQEGSAVTTGPGEDIRRRILLYGYSGTGLPGDQRPLHTLYRAPTTRLISVSPANHGGADLIEVRLAISDSPDTTLVRSANLLVDPRNGWRMVRATTDAVSLTATGVLSTDCEYAPGAESLLKRVVMRDDWKAKNGERLGMTVETTYEIRIPGSLPDTLEFTLTNFGLPEPTGVVWPSRSRTWLWFAAGVAGFVFIGVVFRMLSRRAARRQAAVPPTPS